MDANSPVGRRRTVGCWAVLLAVACSLAAPAVAGADDETRFFRLKLSVEGGFTVDYGEPPGPNLSDYSGVATTSYSTDLVSVARHRRGETAIRGKAGNTKGRVYYAETTSVVSHFPGSEPTEFGCENGFDSHRSGTVRTGPDGNLLPGTPALWFVGDIGTLSIDGDPGGPKEINYTVGAGAHFAADCFDGGHETVNHYLHSADSSGVLLADTSTVESCCKISRGAFNPNSDRSFRDTFGRSVHYELGDNPHPESPEFPIHPGADFPHVFDGESEVGFRIKRISERKAKRIREKIRKLPAAEL